MFSHWQLLSPTPLPSPLSPIWASWKEVSARWLPPLSACREIQTTHPPPPPPPLQTPQASLLPLPFQPFSDLLGNTPAPLESFTTWVISYFTPSRGVWRGTTGVLLLVSTSKVNVGWGEVPHHHQCQLYCDVIHCWDHSSETGVVPTVNYIIVKLLLKMGEGGSLVVYG